MRRFLKENSLSLVFGALFLVSLAAQAIAGWHQQNDELFAEGLHQVTLGGYLTSTSFAVDVTENWQSEYLQFLLFVILTVWLVQRGSPESKPLEDAGQESDEKQKVGAYARADSPRMARVGGFRTALYSRSLGITMGTIFVLSWLVQSVSGWASYNETRLQQLRDPLPWGSYLMHSDFWARTLQNWQSEFLAVGSMAVLAIYLRQRGSPESKPVGSSHEATGVEG
jgi:hypothetical protein